LYTSHYQEINEKTFNIQLDVIVVDNNDATSPGVTKIANDTDGEPGHDMGFGIGTIVILITIITSVVRDDFFFEMR
jgi:hypothetical protein